MVYKLLTVQYIKDDFFPICAWVHLAPLNQANKGNRSNFNPSYVWNQRLCMLSYSITNIKGVGVMLQFSRWATVIINL